MIEIKEKSRNIPMVIQAGESPERNVPDYIEVDVKAGKARFLRTPKLEDVPYAVQMQPNLVVEFYSR